MSRPRWYVRYTDPDLPPGPHRDLVIAAFERVQGRRTLDSHTGRWETTVPRLPDACLQAVLRCDIDASCSRRAGEVWATPMGLLYFALLLEAWADSEAARAAIRREQVLAYHPELDRTVWTTPDALERVMGRRGWVAARADAPAPVERWKPLPATLVRDLIDVDPDSGAHPPLHACCHRHRQWQAVDHSRLLARSRRSRVAGPHEIPVSAVLLSN